MTDSVTPRDARPAKIFDDILGQMEREIFRWGAGGWRAGMAGGANAFVRP